MNSQSGHRITILVLGAATLSVLSASIEPSSAHGQGSEPRAFASAQYRLSSETVRDKIRGGWAGQVIGCAYGGPTEFKWLGRPIPDHVLIAWDEAIIARSFAENPGLYDDVYVDMTFLAAFESLGLDASAEDIARRFAATRYRLWHANQMARLNLMAGLMPPQSGHYRNNPHADDIDFQIEADFIGLITPGMPALAGQYADRVGHIIGYGDGVLGGRFVATMHSVAFVEKDIVAVVERAVQNLPPQSAYARCIRDVLEWWRRWPDDWHRCWDEVQKKWSDDVGCPECVLGPGNIDAKLNGAYIAIGLLYGGGDFGRTVETATRCGQDSDCNPSNAGGILGTLVGYSKIPDRWKAGLDRVEAVKLSGADYTLQEAYSVTYRLATEAVRRGGGSVSPESWTIRLQKPQPPTRVEISFGDLKPASRTDLNGYRLDRPFVTKFEGRGFAIHGRMAGWQGQARCTVRIDGRLLEDVRLQGDLQRHRFPFFWRYDLNPGTHTLEIRKEDGDGLPRLHDFIVYR